MGWKADYQEEVREKKEGRISLSGNWSFGRTGQANGRVREKNGAIREKENDTLYGLKDGGEGEVEMGVCARVRVRVYNVCVAEGERGKRTTDY